MKHYSIAEFEITDPAWVADYVAKVTPMVERHGGRYLARTARAELIEGRRTPLPFHMIIAWDSREDADRFYESEEYRPYREARQAGSQGEFVMVAGEDSSGVARIED